jgi:hypothetical protein
MSLNMPAEFAFDKIKGLDKWPLMFPQDKMSLELQINQASTSPPSFPLPWLSTCFPAQVSAIARLVAASDSMFVDDREFAVRASSSCFAVFPLPRLHSAVALG